MSEQHHLKVLGLSKQNLGDHSKIKKAFTTKIRACPTKYERSAYNLAFEQLTRSKPASYSENEKKICEAIWRGDVWFIHKQFIKDPNLVNFRKKNSNYPLLYLATRSGHYDVVEIVLKHGFSLNFSSDRSSPMHCASYYGYKNLIPLLSKYGIPINIKNFCDNLPIDEACNETIEKLLKSSSKDPFHKLVQKLIDANKALGTLNLQFPESTRTITSQLLDSGYDPNQGRCSDPNTKQFSKRPVDVRKILLRSYFDHNFEDWINAFHGTNFGVLDSIAINGLHGVGEMVDGKTLAPELGHIGQRVKVREENNWAKAIFVSPSIYYAGNSVYAKYIQIDGIKYCPIVQAKIKPMSYVQHEHTLHSYQHKAGEPINVEYRIPCDDVKEEEKKQVLTSPPNPNVKVVAIMLVRAAFLQEHDDYNRVTSMILASEEENNFIQYGRQNLLNQ